MVRRDAGAAVGAARARGVPRAAGVRGGAAAVDRRGRHPAHDRGAALGRARRPEPASASKCRGMFWPLAAYARRATLVASVFSVDPRVSLVDSKQLVLLIIVPLTYRLLRGRRALLGGRRDHHGRRGQRDVGHRPASDPELRSPRAAPAGAARALHDLLGPADARGVRGGLARDVREAPPRRGPRWCCRRCSLALVVTFTRERAGSARASASACSSCCATSG